MREAPALYIIDDLTARGAAITAFDPEAMDVAAKSYLNENDKVRYATDRYDAVVGADALLLLTEWKIFLSPDFELIKRELKHPIIFDGRNQYNADVLTDMGFEHFRIGVGSPFTGSFD
jgi:UDPglucose 6-dehydrogenase